MGKNDIITVQVLKDEVFSKGFNAFKPIAEFIEYELYTVDKRYSCEVDLKTRKVWVYNSEDELIGEIGKDSWIGDKWRIQGDTQALSKLADYITKHY